ncbi:MAG: alpha/beta fold hydrolase, partial [Ilumatobacteraceae bacterium]
MPRASFTSTDNRNIELEYDHFGNPKDPALLLIAGFTAQMVAWDEVFCTQLADRGHFVIRFDNRDCGLSTKLHGVPSNSDAVIMAAMMETEMPPVAYTLSDMAADAAKLLDHLAIERAHVMGASMGGMIAQTFAIEHPHRTKTLISIMSQPGELTVGQPTQEAMELIVTPAPSDRDEYIAFAPKWQLWQSKKYRSDELSIKAAIRDFDRSNYPEGGPRQMAAIYASGSRAEGLQKLQVPTLVIHGTEDQLITPSGGERTAELIPNSTLLMVDDMGHDMPEPLWPLYLDAISKHTALVAH